jgi:hypothetical protein
VVVHAPAFRRNCRVDPDGQGIPIGTVIIPPEGLHPTVQVLLVMLTFGGVALKIGQGTQATGTVVALALALTQLVVVLRQRAKTVIADVP